MALPVFVFLCVYASSSLAAKNGSFDVKTSGDDLFMLTGGPKLSLLRSADKGKTFSLVSSISFKAGASAPRLFIDRDSIKAFWLSGRTVFNAASFNKGITWTSPEAFMELPEAPAFIRIFIDPASGSAGIFYIDGKDAASFQKKGSLPVLVKENLPPEQLISAASQDRSITMVLKETDGKISILRSSDLGGSWKYEVYFTGLPPSFDRLELEASGGALFAAWTDGNMLLTSRSLDNGNSWSRPLSISAPVSAENGLRIVPVKVAMLMVQNSTEVLSIPNTPVPAPEISIEAVSYTRLPATLEISSGPGIDNKVLTKNTLQISSDPVFPAALTVNIDQPGGKSLIPSGSLKDGKYFIRLSAWDGIDTAYSKAKTLVIDNTGPGTVKAGLYVSSALQKPDGDILGTAPSKDAEIIIDLSEKMDIRAVLDVSAESLGKAPVSLQSKWEDDDTLKVFLPSGTAFDDGIYRLKISGTKDLAGNGMASSMTLFFIIDRTPPALRLISPAADMTVEVQGFTIKGASDIGATVTVNGTAVKLAAAGEFSSPFSLLSGNNLITVEALDKAGNSIKIERKIFFDSPAPRIDITKPSSKDWYRKDSTIAVEASVSDRQDDVDDETEAEISVNGSKTGSSVIYDKASKTLSGFISLPDGLPEGNNDLDITLADTKGNAGRIRTSLQIDNKAPDIDLEYLYGLAYSNRTDRITIPLEDDGSGADPGSSIVNVFLDNATVEGRVSADISKCCAVFTPYALLDPSARYRVEVSTRDRAGNTEKKAPFFMQLDLTAPVIALDSDISPEAAAKELEICGRIDKPTVLRIRIMNNSSHSYDLPVVLGRFSGKLALDPGNNRIVVSATDLAGNRTEISKTVMLAAAPSDVCFNFDGKNAAKDDFVGPSPVLKVTDTSGAALAGAAVLIDGTAAAYNAVDGSVTLPALSQGSHRISVTVSGTEYTLDFRVDTGLRIASVVPCPNPFNPDVQQLSITYNLSGSSPVNLYVFDAAGRSVWRSTAGGSTGYNSILWNGRSQDGQTLANGVYILQITANDAAGKYSSARSRIVVLR